MIHLRRIIAVLLLVLSAVTSAVVIAARQQPLPNAMSILHFEMCQPPCWIGITPGETSLDRAIILARRLYGQQGYTVTIHQTSLNWFHLEIKDGNPPFPGSINLRTINGQTIDTIEFYMTQGNVERNRATFYFNVLDVYRQFGDPTTMGFWMRNFSGENGPFMTYGDGKIIVSGSRSSGNNLLQRLIQGITFQIQGGNLAQQIKWRGFKSISRYYSEWISINP